MPLATASLKPTPRRRVLALWLLFVAVCATITVRSHYVADLSAFLPAAPTAAQAVLLNQVKSGVAARLVLIGIEGGDEEARTEASKRLAAALRSSGLFETVNNGDTSEWQQTGRFLFEHRYLLSPAIDAQHFTVEGLRDAIDDTVALLGTPAGGLIKPILDRDPTGETLRLAEAMLPTHAPRKESGVWVSRQAPRAVLMAITQATGADLDGQARALKALRQDFAKVAAPGLTLQLSGAGVFGVASRSLIKTEVERLAALGGVLVLALLGAALGSWRALGLALLPVATGVLAGIAAVSLGFGQVHGMTLGFGTTLIGEAVDYAIYYLIQARRRAKDQGDKPIDDSLKANPLRDDKVNAPAAGHASATHALSPGASDWLQHQWPTVRLGLLTSLCGFAALVFSGFPGLSQLGVFSIAGLLAAALTTRCVFPQWAPHGAAATGLRAPLGRVALAAAQALPRAAWVLRAVALAAVIALCAWPSPWRGDLSGLSPITADQLALDTQLRHDLGSDTGTLIALDANSEAEALATAEAAEQRLAPLIRDGVLQGADSPAHWLPSPAVQSARRAALPDAATLRVRLQAATTEGPLPATRLQGFITDVDTARHRAVLDRAALEGTPLARAVDALLDHDGAHWRVFLNLHQGTAPIAVERVQAAMVGLPVAAVIHIKDELDALYRYYLREALWQAWLGALAIVALLAVRLRSLVRLAHVVEPMAAAVVITLAAAAVNGVALGILHAVGLLLVVAVGSNYALFFDQLRQRASGLLTDEVDTLASLWVANLATVLSFGLLATSKIPALQALGSVVAPGTLLCLVLAAAYSRPLGQGVHASMAG